jgi:hypothetical protein
VRSTPIRIPAAQQLIAWQDDAWTWHTAETISSRGTRCVHPLWCWTLAFMIWLLPLLSPPLLFPVAGIAPLFPVLLIVLLLRPGVSASIRAQ